jgi:hypothetical protein
MENRLVIDLDKDFEITLECETEVKDWSHLIKVNKSIKILGEEFHLGSEALESILLDIQNICINVNEQKVGIDNLFRNINIGFYYNIFTFNLYNTVSSGFPILDIDKSIKYHWLEGNDLMLLCYEKDRAVQLELIPLYPRFEDANFEDFSNWIHDYKPITILEMASDKFKELNHKVQSISERLVK